MPYPKLLGSQSPTVERRLRIEPHWLSVLDSADVMQVTYLEAFSQINTLDPAKAGAFEVRRQRNAEDNLVDATRSPGRMTRPQPQDS